MKPELAPVVALLFAIVGAPALSEPTKIQTPTPVIYLADNLGEKDNLGWCIDTLGRNFAERLQAHSCKPQGDDVQFSFDADTGQIQSVEYAEFCMAHQPNDESTFALVTCNPNAIDQQFTYEPDSHTIRTAADENACVSVGESTRSADPFMSRKLLLSDCDMTDGLSKEWVISK